MNNIKLARKRWVVASLALGSAAWLIWYSSWPSPVAALAPVTSNPATATPTTRLELQEIPLPVEPVLREPVHVEVAGSVAPRSEIESTQQMIAAHAVLRDPRVADPDSAENRMILQTMVLKALANRAPSSAP
jgi:hypothetical protein